MKRIPFSFLVLTTGVLTLCSCTANHRKQIFVSGDFTGTNEYDEADTFSFSVGLISENEFGKMAGEDVVKDEVGGGYYKLVLSMRKEGGERWLHFHNLHDAFNGATGTEIQYVDDNDNWIKPYKESNSQLGGTIYSITYHSGSSGADVDLFTYFYSKDK